MTVHTVFAQINNGEILNIVVGEYYECDVAAKTTYGVEAFAVDVTQIPVEIGDLYENGNFYRMVNGHKKKIDPIPTDSEKIALLEETSAETSTLLEDLATLILELAEAQE